MKKLSRLILLALTAVLILTVSACGPAFEYDEDAAADRAKHAIELANTGDYEAMVSMFGDTLKAALPVETLKSALDPVLAAAGSFKSYKNIKSTGTIEDGVDYITVAAVCEYENSTHIYTISMTADMQLAGFYIK